MSKVKNYPRLTGKMLGVLLDFPGDSVHQKEEGMNRTLRKVASAGKDNVDPNDDTLLHLKELINRVYKNRHFSEKKRKQQGDFLFNVFVTLFSGTLPDFGQFVTEKLTKEVQFVNLAGNHDLRMAGFNIDIKQDQWGRFPVIQATLNFGHSRYKGVLLGTSSNLEEVNKLVTEGVIGSPELVIWGGLLHGYRYLEKKGLRTNFAVVSKKVVNNLH